MSPYRKKHEPCPIESCQELPPSVIGVTLADEEYMPMACEAVKRWKRYSGQECLILSCERDTSWWSKYDLAALLGPVKICFFDADVWAVNPYPLDDMWKPGFDLQVVRDPGVNDSKAFPHYDCMLFDIEPARYFNGGWFTCDLANPKVIAWLNTARELTIQVKNCALPQWNDFGEQTSLNVAAATVGLDIEYMDPGFSFFHKAWKHKTLTHPESIYAVHAAGYFGVEEKLHALFNLARTYGA